MKDIYNEQEIEKLAENFAKKTTDKLKSDLLDDFYQNIQDYLHEHYNNFKDKVEGDLISSICGTYKKDPKDYKFASLRQKMFNENKEELTKILNDEAIEKSVEDVIKQYTSRDYHFNWKWEDGIARIILKHIDKFSSNKRTQQTFKRENDRLKDKIKNLEAKIEDIEDIIV